MLNNSKAFSSFSADDLLKAKKFYSEVLGLSVKDNPMGVIELAISENNFIMVYPKPDHSPATFTVLNFPVDNIDATVDKLISKGVRFEQYDAPVKTDEKGICRNQNGPKIAWFKDPAGNIFSVLEK